MSFVFAYELLIRSFDSLNIHGATKLIQTPVKPQKNYTNIVFLSTNVPLIQFMTENWLASFWRLNEFI